MVLVVTTVDNAESVLSPDRLATWTAMADFVS
jgi:hypothetical protein